MLQELSHNVGAERWKETPLKKVLGNEWGMAQKSANPILSTINLPDNNILITICNGQVDRRWFDDRSLPQGILVSCDNNVLNIRIIKQSTLEKTLVIHHVVQSNGAGIYVEPQIKIELEAEAKGRVLFVESGDGHYLTRPKITAMVNQKAALEWIKISLNAANAHSFYDFTCLQHEKSSVSLISYQSRGATLRSDIHLKSLGAYTQTNFAGLNLGKDQQHLAHVINLEHTVAHCTSAQQIKNLLNDQATALFDGMIHVYQDAQKTDADQLTRSLLLSDHARAMTIPRLEIYADDVRCTHGATIGFLEPEALFYLRSRGISLIKARAILMRAYAAEVIEKITDETLRTWLMHVLDEDLVALNQH